MNLEPGSPVNLPASFDHELIVHTSLPYSLSLMHLLHYCKLRLIADRGKIYTMEMP